MKSVSLYIVVDVNELKKLIDNAIETKKAARHEARVLYGCNLNVEANLMDPMWNRVYVWSKSNGPLETYWSGSIDRGNKPYYCPSGWKRYGIKVATSAQEFDAKWENWHIAYHGTANANALKILATGLKVSTDGCFFDEGIPRVYVSPSIEYSAHPRYARPWKREMAHGKYRWYQLVFQCRVNPESVDYIGPETLIHDEQKNSVKVDSNYNNNELEWVIKGKQGATFIKDDIVCYGLMIRTSDVDPKDLDQSAWWEDSNHARGY